MSYHFLSGLPRSGSSLLASILRQNPLCTAHIMSPLGFSVDALLESMSAKNEAHLFYTEDKRARMVESLFDAYYEDELEKIVFDNNRRWCAHLALLLRVFPECRVICCVRPIAHIFDSLERLLRSNPLYLSRIVGCTENTNVYDRVRMYMSDGGVIGFAYRALREAYYGPHRDRLIFIEYARLAKDPAGVMEMLHEKLTLPKYSYNFAQIEPLPDVALFDQTIGTPGLHILKSRVEYNPCNSILPPDLYASAPPSFWQVNKTETSRQ